MELIDSINTKTDVAPEILVPKEERFYTFAVDIWSAGVVGEEVVVVSSDVVVVVASDVVVAVGVGMVVGLPEMYPAGNRGITAVGFGWPPVRRSTGPEEAPPNATGWVSDVGSGLTVLLSGLRTLEVLSAFGLLKNKG